MPDQQKDPFLSSFFAIKFDGAVSGAFREVTGLSSDNEVVDYKASGDKGVLFHTKLPARVKWGNITLKRGVTDSMEMWKWRGLVEQGKMKDARKNGTLTMYDTEGKEVAKWHFTDAWPTKLSGPAPNAGSNDVAVEEIEITHTGCTRES